MVKNILIFLLIVFIVAQFFRQEKNKSDQPVPNDIHTMVAIPAEADHVLKVACNDCHSNNTHYPWYAEIQPVTWWLNDHIKDGKRHMNFNEFKGYRPWRQYEKMEEIIELVKEDEMPLWSYSLIHRDANLDAKQKNTLINWAEDLRAKMRKTYPADSLIKPKRPTR